LAKSPGNTVYGGQNLTWVQQGVAWAVRHCGTELARVVPDEKYPGMWRVRSPDGRLSDMANITWAKDAAATMALAVLNRSGDVGIVGGDGAQKGKAKSAVQVPPDTKRAPSDGWTFELQSRIPEAAE